MDEDAEQQWRENLMRNARYTRRVLNPGLQNSPFLGPTSNFTGFLDNDIRNYTFVAQGNERMLQRNGSIIVQQSPEDVYPNNPYEFVFQSQSDYWKYELVTAQRLLHDNPQLRNNPNFMQSYNTLLEFYTHFETEENKENFE
jgi:hypothetical protein